MPGEGPVHGGVLLYSLVAAVMLPVAISGQTAPPPQVIDPAWLMVDSSTKTATFKLIAGLTGLNGALNFNGFRDGGLTFTVPLGWKVVMRFSNNDGDLPHSAEVIADTKPLPYGPVDPAFDRAVTLRLSQGLEAGAEDDIRFVASRAGSFLIFCAVPGHGVSGMWIRFRASESAERPCMAATPAAGS
jgi:uncharacterized cupredoxin-like copper-binding protein